MKFLLLSLLLGLSSTNASASKKDKIACLAISIDPVQAALAQSAIAFTERVLNTQDVLPKKLDPTRPKKYADAIESLKKSRQASFTLQAILRLLERMQNPDIVAVSPNWKESTDATKSALDVIKNLEGALGKVLGAAEILRQYSSLPGEVNRDLVNSAQADLSIAYEQALKILDDFKRKDLYELILSIDTPYDPPASLILMRRALAAEAQEIKEDLSRDRYNASNENLNRENGLHEFRRRARWITLYIAALGLVMEVQPNAPDTKISDLLARESPGDIAEANQGSYLPQNRTLALQIGIPRDYIQFLNLIVWQLGKVKDTGELYEDLVARLLRVRADSRTSRERQHSIAITEANDLLPKLGTAVNEFRMFELLVQADQSNIFGLISQYLENQ